MLRICLVVALFGGFTAAPSASASQLSRHHDVWDNEWQDLSAEWESLFGQLLEAIQRRKLQEAHDLMRPMTGVLARINTLAQPAIRRDQDAAIRAVAAILVERSREALLQFRFQNRSDLDMLAVYITQLVNTTDYDALKRAGRAHVRHKRWQAGKRNSGIFAVGLGTGYASMVGAFLAMHAHLWSTATPISVMVGTLLGGTAVKFIGQSLPRGPRRSDRNIVERRLLDCRHMLDLH